MTNAIRVWLEAGYDHGRYGAWMLDLPGCFVWEQDRPTVLAAVPARVDAFGRWLAGHGEQVDTPSGPEVDVVERVAPTRIAGYERNATFAADHRAVPIEEVDRTLHWLDYATADLTKVEALIASGHRVAPLPSGRREPNSAAELMDERSALDVLNHVADVDIWLASRLDRTARYDRGAEATDDTADLPILADRVAWTAAIVRELWSRDSALEGADGKGETWTVAKVLRRLVYHSLDHLGELEQRLARAERPADEPANEPAN